MKLTKYSAIFVIGAILLSTAPTSLAQVPRGPQDVKTKSITLNKTAFNKSLRDAVGPKVIVERRSRAWPDGADPLTAESLPDPVHKLGRIEHGRSLQRRRRRVQGGYGAQL